MIEAHLGTVRAACALAIQHTARRDSSLDDLAQDAFLFLNTKLHTLKSILDMKAWAFSMTLKWALDQLKRPAPQPVSFTDVGLDPWGEPAGAEEEELHSV